MHTLPRAYEFLMIPVSAALLIAAHSRQGLLFGVLNNRFTVFLGKMTLPVYLSQVSVIYLISRFGADLSFGIKTLILTASVFALSGIYLALTNHS